MRKLAHLEADPRLVQGMFANVKRWTAWMPGVQSVRVLEQGEGTLTALIQQRWMGRALEQTWSFRFEEERVLQEQVRGVFRRWRADWSFRKAPNGGTTVAVHLDFDLGWLGIVTPRRMLQETLDRMFDEVIDKGRGRIRAILAGETVSIPSFELPTAQVLLQVFETERGLEIRLGGRRYLLQAIDDL